ncbi:Undecaprenyl-phosphate 4-deoxy-4-formamido-L-arabinose transferase [Achromobacter xylosoxidans]|nr:Undecaprenyl-phosphate 4-deoxy-4-formamido-L-arabinose transferase [Achromobacter xylosoxidans]CUJ62840.1 Undecaprenyl-phosphate 4-deoxy-4-formamido-L-arabinose transferase [Achromobacter xylosoxidans]
MGSYAKKTTRLQKQGTARSGQGGLPHTGRTLPQTVARISEMNTPKPTVSVCNVAISVVVPAYRSGQTLRPLYERISSTLASLTSNWEIIIVDDCSPDDSWAVLSKLREADERVRIVRLGRNHGQQHATLCGLGYARGNYVVTIDDDLQCFPEDIPAFIQALRSGKHVVIGKIAERKEHKWWRNVGSALNQYLARTILGKPKSLSLSSFRAMSRPTVNSLVGYKGAHPHIAALLLKSVPVAFFGNVDIRHAPRADGSNGSYSLRKLIKTFSYLLINHSYIPLRIMIGWGVFISLLSTAFAAWVAVRALVYHDAPTGWSSLAVLISFLSGNVLLALGIVGEYIGRLVEENNQTGQFSIFEEHT